MATSVMPSVQKLADDFQKTHETFPIIEKILAVLKKSAKTV